MKKLLGTTLLILILLMMLTIPTYAMSFNVKLTPTKRTITPGSEVTVTVSTSNLNIGGNGMNSFMCTLQYDTNVFEIVRDTDITGVDGWSILYNSANNKILADLNETTTGGFIQQDSNLFKIKFKVKANATAEKGDIQLLDPTTSNGRMDVVGTSEKLTIYLKSLSSDKYLIEEDNTILNVLPKTEIATFKANITGGNNITIKDANGTTVTTGYVKTGCKAIAPSGEEYTVVVKGDVNGDGIFDVVDLSQVVYHIIEKIKLQGVYEKAGDLDSGGKLDIIDLSNLVLILVDKATW
ncbi:MAG: hypothetical protein IJ223_03140 [Clostridia bacterium]|nr:hypothetical protein [Clostridia bacterium]